MKRPSLALVAFTQLAVAGTSLYSQGQAQNQAPGPAVSRADETLELWNDIGNKLIAMAQDFPEDKYDFKLEKDERTFAENLLHATAVDYDLMSSVSGSRIGPDFGKNKHNPSPDIQDEGRRGETDAAGRRGRSEPDSTAGRPPGWIKLRNTLGGINWFTIPTTGCGPSSIAASTTASSWSTIAQTTRCRRIRVSNKVLERLPS